MHMLLIRACHVIWPNLVGLLFAQYVYANSDTGRIIEAAAYIQVVDIDLNFAGAIRETRFTSFDFSLREKLSERIDGAIHFGYLNVDQNANPVLTGQDTQGGYLGIDLRGHLIKTHPYSMRGIFYYRYAMTEQRGGDQTVEWSWHELRLKLDNQINIGNNLQCHIAVSTTLIDGVKRASGNLEQRIEFEQEDHLTGHIGLQYKLNRKGKIGFELLTGSRQGGRLIFKQAF